MLDTKAGALLTTVAADVAEHVPLDTVTVYDPTVAGVTVTDCVVAPLLQELPEEALEVNTTELYEHSTNDPEAEIVGVGVTEIITGFVR